MDQFLQSVDNAIVWYNDYIGGYAILLFLIPTGVYFIIRLKFLNVTKLKHSIQIVAGKYDKDDIKGDVNSFKALTTALSATVGTGNIVGVSLAIYWGGPGAVFWMWVTGFLGMILKYAETTLSHKYRHFNKDGTVSGGPMYSIRRGITEVYNWPIFAKVLAGIFAVATILASLGTGNMAQANSIAHALNTNYSIPVLYTGIVIALMVLLIIVGGLKRISEVTSKLVPFMAITYFIASVIIIGSEYKHIPDALYLIVSSAFTGTAATGGFVGSAFLMTLVWGVRRGLFSNEAGQGSAPIAHAAAKTKYPAREGLVASLEPLVDTLIICTLTALMIITTGAWQSGAEGVEMTIIAMDTGLAEIGISGIGKHIVALGLFMFAFSTLISWSYYGTRAANYLMGEKAIIPYRFIYGGFVFLGSIWGLDLVWHFVDMVITFMTLPNLIGLLLLSGIVIKETNEYFDHMKIYNKENKLG
ncbi:MAG: sodium:alanine symporter family protein [Marinilabiliales bacterium]|nr:MAG: sodium:alanine symporter family protein [Marinilabiliales bacterium]